MKFVIAIAMFALVGFSSISAAAIDSGNNEMSDLMKAYKPVLESLLQDASKQITEYAALDENIYPESFDQESIFGDEPIVISTEEEQGEPANGEFSTVEDNHIIEDVGNGIRCSWKGLNGQCCQSLKVIRIRIKMCIGIKVSLPAHAQLYLKINGRNIWSHSVGVRDRRFNVCFKRGPVKICINLYNLRFSRHYINVCLRVSARLAWFKFGKNLGCISKRFALDQVQTTINNPDPFNVLYEHNDALPPTGYVHDNNVVRFEA